MELRTNCLGTPSYVPQSYTEQEVLKKIADGRRPALDQIVGFFWAPGTAVACGSEQTHLVRRVQSWDLPAMITMLGQSWTFKEIYQVWCLMPLVVKPARKGKRRRYSPEENHRADDAPAEDGGDQVFLVQCGTPLSPDTAGGALALQGDRQLPGGLGLLGPNPRLARTRCAGHKGADEIPCGM